MHISSMTEGPIKACEFGVGARTVGIVYKTGHAYFLDVFTAQNDFFQVGFREIGVVDIEGFDIESENFLAKGRAKNDIASILPSLGEYFFGVLK